VWFLDVLLMSLAGFWEASEEPFSWSMLVLFE
jgi:hypothetical protein